jgi:hypothetical protein
MDQVKQAAGRAATKTDGMTMGAYSKQRDSDCRESDWPLGLYRRGVSFRFRRMAGGRRIFQVWGQMPEGDAIRKASRYNMDIEDGRMPVEERARREMTFESFAREVWLKKKTAEISAKSLARYTAVVDHCVHYLDHVRKTPSAALASVNYEIAADYVAHRASAPLMPNGQSKFTRAIRHGASKKTIHFEREVLFQLFKEAVRR